MSRKVAEEMLPRLRQRYVGRGREGRTRLVDEVCEQWGYSRKHAIKLLGAKAGWGGDPGVRKGRPPKYGREVVEVLWRIWKVAEQPCGKRLKALLPEWLPHYQREHGGLAAGVRKGVMEVSAAQIDRLLAPRKAQAGHHGRCGTKPGGLLKTQIPIRTDNWDITRPGFLEADTVAHCGGSLEGDFIWSVTYTDSLKSFQPKSGPKNPNDGDPSNPNVDFHGQKRSNATHQSTTDRQAQFARKGNGREARLSFGLHALMENRNGLCVQAMVTTAYGTTESTGATELLARQIEQSEKSPETLAADKGYHSAGVVGFCRNHGIKPHIAQQKGRSVKGLDGRTTRSLGYQTSQKVRKRIEEVFGWCKEIGGLRRIRKRGTDRVGLSMMLILTTYNLVRMGKLLGSPPANGLATA